MSNLIQLPEGSICWPAAALSCAAQDVCHARTDLRRGRGGEHAGVTRWERRSADMKAWVEWDWVEIGAATVVQTDPLDVRSNVLLLDDHGRPLLSSRRKAALATLVYLLPWQGPVLDALRARTASRCGAAEQRLAA